MRMTNNTGMELSDELAIYMAQQVGHGMAEKTEPFAKMAIDFLSRRSTPQTGVAETVKRLRGFVSQTRDCTVCDGDGIKSSGRECGGCDGAGKVLVYRGSVAAAMSEAADALESLSATGSAVVLEAEPVAHRYRDKRPPSDDPWQSVLTTGDLEYLHGRPNVYEVEPLYSATHYSLAIKERDEALALREADAVYSDSVRHRAEAAEAKVAVLVEAAREAVEVLRKLAITAGTEISAKNEFLAERAWKARVSLHAAIIATLPVSPAKGEGE